MKGYKEKTIHLFDDYHRMRKKKYRKIKSLLLVFFFFVSTSPVSIYGQKDSIRFKRISIEEGLSQVTINCILQDSSGLMWFGTQNGLNRYDGYNFEIYRHHRKDSTTLSDNYVLDLYEDRSGVLWIGTKNGLNRFNRKTGRFISYKNDPGNPNSLSHNDVRVIYEDSTGVLWIGTLGGGLNKFDRKNQKIKHYTPENSKLTLHDIREIFEDKSGVLWIGTNGGGLYKFNRNIKQFIPYHHDSNDPHSLSSDNVMSIYEDQYNVMWIGTKGGGLNKFHRNTGKFEHYRHIKNDSRSLSHDDVNTIGEDQQGKLWIGTHGGGLNRFNRKTGHFTRYIHIESNPHSLSHNHVLARYKDRSGVFWVGTYLGGLNTFGQYGSQFTLFSHDTFKSRGLTSNIVWSIYEDRAGMLWVGTYAGLNRINRKNGESTHFKHQPDNPGSISHNYVRSIFEDRSGTLWIGTEGGGLDKFNRNNQRFMHYKYNAANPTSLSNNTVWFIYEDRAGVLWIGTDNGLNRLNRKSGQFTRFKFSPDNPNSLSNNEVRVILEDKFGILWIGTNGGLNEFDGKNNHFTRYQPNERDLDDLNSLSHNRIRCIYEDKSGTLWIGTANGLNKFNREKKTFKSYHQKDGLPNDLIYGILEDQEGNLWISTNKGISRFNPKKNTFKNYYVDDGLQSNEFNAGAYFQNKRGEMFFGGIKGFNTFFPGKIKDDPYVPQIVITDFLLSNKSVPLKCADPASPLNNPILGTDEIKLTHKQRFFSFEFAALHYAAPERNKYKYKMAGWDKEWIETDWKNRRATYNYLPAGEYTFHVKGSNKHGVWNKVGTSIKLRIKPPPWETWWAYIIYILVGIGVLILSWSVWDQKKKVAYERSVTERLKQIDKLKDEFLSITSHELRTPLNGIIGLVESLIDGAAGPVNKKLAHNLSMIVAIGKRLASLVNDILDFSSLKNKSLVLKKKPVDLYTLTDVILTLSKPIMGNKELELINEIEPDVPPVEADEDRLQQIMHNLVGNAIKSTESGTVKVSAEVKGNILYVKVSDTGIGIPKEEYERIFEFFAQVEDSTTVSYGGTGLGLAITKKLVELNGGKIWVESTIDRGSTFTFTLPLAKKDFAQTQMPKQPMTEVPVFEPSNQEVIKEKPVIPQSYLSGDKYHILVVDDDPISHQVLHNQLSLKGYNVTAVMSGYEALKVLEGNHHFDLILLDIMMPRMSGHEVCKKIRKHYPAHELPIIFLTAKKHETDLLNGFTLGANDFVTKPVSKNELLARVQTQLLLLEINRNLEKEVEKRTQQLNRKNKSLEKSHHELQDTQSQLVQSEKMRALGDLVAGVAHEINNPTSFAYTTVYNLRRDMEKLKAFLKELAGSDADIEIMATIDEKFDVLFKHLNNLQEGTTRIKDILKDLSTFSRKDEGETKPVDCHEGIQATLNLSKAQYKNQVDFITYFNVPLKIRGNLTELNQVFMNIIVNACEAIIEKQKSINEKTRGTLIIQTRKRNDKAVISFQDTGIGMSEEVKQKMFDPFFTTKPLGEGTGLGLPISFGIIKRHHGRIDVSSEKEKGTTITLYLPLDTIKNPRLGRR